MKQAYSLGRCLRLPWTEDEARACTAACSLGSALLAACGGATVDRHCRSRVAASGRVSASGAGDVNRNGSLVPKPAELLVECTTARVLSKRQPRAVRDAVQQQDRDRDRDRDSCGSFETVTVGELATMVINGALPSHSRVRAAPQRAQLTGGAGRSHHPSSDGAASSSSHSSEGGPWVMMDSFIDMSVPIEHLDLNERVVDDRYADLVERL